MPDTTITEVYELDTETQALLDTLFTYHPPNESQIERYQALRQYTKGLAELTHKLAPDSEERTQAILHLRGFLIWANAILAINEAE